MTDTVDSRNPHSTIWTWQCFNPLAASIARRPNHPSPHCPTQLPVAVLSIAGAASAAACVSLPFTQDHRRTRRSGFHSPIPMQKLVEWHQVDKGRAFYTCRWHQQGLSWGGLNNRYFFLTVLEAKNPRSKHQRYSVKNTWVVARDSIQGRGRVWL